VSKPQPPVIRAERDGDYVAVWWDEQEDAYCYDICIDTSPKPDLAEDQVEADMVGPDGWSGRWPKGEPAYVRVRMMTWDGEVSKFSNEVKIP